MVAMEKYEAGVKDEYACWLTAQNGFLYLEVTPCGREKPISILGTPVLTEKNGEVVIDMVDPVAFGRDGTSLPVEKTYIMGSDPFYFRLMKDGRFSMSSAYNNIYAEEGAYSLEGGRLVLSSRDCTYVFEIQGNTLVYREKDSTGEIVWAQLYDGCVFQSLEQSKKGRA